METSSSSFGHTYTDLGLEAELKEKLENVLKRGKFTFYVIVDCGNFHILKIRIVNFRSSQKVQNFRFLNGTTYHVIVNGAIWSNPLIFLTH